MEDHMKELNNVLTHLITVGNPFNNEGKDVIVCITGNPGLPDFYKDFAKQLYDATKVDIVVIGQAGHEEIPTIKSNNIISGREHFFNINGQLKHKLELLQKMIHQKSRLHIIGHSIGAWMAIELIDCNEDIAERVSSINLLFPTIQHIAQSKNGKKMNSVVRKFHFLTMLFYYILDYVPGFIKDYLFKAYINYKKYNPNVFEAIHKYMRASVMENVLFLAYDEMDKVLDLNIKTIEKFKSKINVIYSHRDGWAPVEFITPLEKFKPDINLHLVSYDHAFILRHCEPVVDLVKDYILSRLKS